MTRLLSRIWRRDRFSTKSFVTELLENLAHVTGQYKMDVSPDWQDARAKAQFEAYIRVQKNTKKRKVRLGRYLDKHYRTVYLKAKMERKAEAVRTRAHEQRLWRVFDHDLVVVQ